MSTPQTRLREFIEKYYNNPTHFSEVLGVKPGSLNGYLNSDLVFKTKSTLERLSETGINIDWYRYGEGDEVDFDKLPERFKKQAEGQNDKKANGDDIYRIPKALQGMLSNIKLHIMSVSAATGTLTDLNDLPTTFMPLALGINIDADTHDAIYVNGQSMEDAGISTGDIIIFEVQKNIPSYDCMIVGALNGMPIMKHLVHQKDGKILLKSDSPFAKDIVLGDLEDLTLFGIVKKTIKDHAPVRKSN